jgi:hypothetical protein
MKIPWQIILLLSVVMVFAAGCKNVSQYEEYGWSITANPKTNTLSVTKDELGKIAHRIHLTLKKENKITTLSGWTIEQQENKLIINTSKPRATKWEFTLSEKAVNITCSNNEGFITGLAPAGEKRIPARIASQDNGIMYTQMGLVSSTNIYNLFDMGTDNMIRFPKESQLFRNKEENTLMDINVPVIKGGEFTVINDYYTDVIGLSEYQKTDFKPVYKPIPERFKTAPTGWSSWYCYYMSPDQEDLVKETNALAEKLQPYGLEYVQLDAAYTRGKEANYLEWNNEMYPKGGKWWFKQVLDQGLKPGLWLNPHGANYANPAMADEYPEDFFLRDSSGNLSSACCSADSTVVRLDYTNPEVIEKHTKPMVKKLVNDWGFAYIKAGGWGTWMDFYEENRESAYNPDMDSREAYISAIDAIREIMGEDNYILGCAMHEIGLGFGYFDGSRTGGDDYASWTGEGHWSGGMQTYFNSLFGENWLNGICWWSDPDDVMIRDPLNMDEAQTIVSSISLTGQAYMISDFIADFSQERLQDFLHSDYNIGWAEQYPDKVKPLPERKLELYRKTMPSMPIKAMDLYPFKAEPTCCPQPEEFPRALDLKVNSKAGRYDVVALYNWEDQKTEKVLDLQEDLGLKSETRYLVFDFWNQKLSGSSTVMIKKEVPAHGTRALIIKEASENPQLLATSRHLTAAYSIKELDWNKEEKSLTGTSSTVPEDEYTLFIHVPEDHEFNKVEINAENVSHELNSKGMLKLSFTGKEDPVDWKVVFN